jgi:diguanylate cyclase (GGDEF)-like protein
MRGRKEETERLRTDLADARRRVAALEEELRSLRTSDPLTGLPLSATLEPRLVPEIERSKRYSRPLTVAAVDIDGFRAINKHRGRKVGDEVLMAVARLLSELTRASDFVSRSGADEFVIVMPETHAVEALQAFERIFLELEALRVGEIESVPVSVGVAEWERGQTGEQLISAAGARIEVARAMGGGRAAAADAPDQADAFAEGGARGDVIAALAEALVERDRYTGEHSESVVDLVERVARALALDTREIDQIKAAALLHDIGKVAIPDDVLNKPGPLDAEEWKVMHEHPVIGERILRAIPGMGSIARIVRHEHERFDGGGYPDGISGEQIPIGARIILACDAYHAMTSDRPYRKGMSHADAIAELVAHAGTQFDPQVTEMLIGALYGQRQGGGGRTEAEVAASAA